MKNHAKRFTIQLLYRMSSFGLLFVCVSILSAGCCTRLALNSNDQVDRFMRTHPLEYYQYQYLNPINLDDFRCMLGLQLAEADSITRELKFRFGSTPGINEYCQLKIDQDSSNYYTMSRHFSDLEVMSKPNGVICQFSRTNAEVKEIGLLVIKEGNVITNDVWVTDYLKKTNSTPNIVVN